MKRTKTLVVLLLCSVFIAGCKSPTKFPKTPWPAVMLKPGGPPTILIQPISRIKERHTYVDFTVLATNAGGGALTYQWRADGSNIFDATNHTYYISAVDVTNVASYTCVVSGTGSVTSDPAHLSVFYTYYTNSVAGTLVAPIGAFSIANPAITLDGETFNRVSSNYFHFYGPYASPQVGDFQNTTYMPKMTVDTISPDNNQVHTGIRVWQNFDPWAKFSDANNAPPNQPTAAKVGPLTLATAVNPDESSYRITVYYKNGTLGSNTRITFNWLYHQ
jgi:hypothetical protein